MNKSKQTGVNEQKLGFTIIELIVVVAVVGILAALVYVGYNTVQSSAKEASLKSDLEKGSALIMENKLENGKYATSIEAISGLSASGGNSLSLSTYNNGFCLMSANASLSTTYYFSSRTNKVQEGTCEGDVATTAGSGVSGNTDGPASTAEIGYPLVLAFAPNGNLYVGQANGYVGIDDAIRIITPAGVVSTLHNGSSFNGYGGFAFSSDGTLYVSDSTDNRIKRVSTAGVVTNYAGSGVAGSGNGAIGTAQFNSPQDLVFDYASGNLYISDYNNYRVRKITPGGTVSTLAGSTYGFQNGTGTGARFKSVEGIVVDSSGNVFVADWEDRKIRKITAAGVTTTFAGSGVYGSADGVGIAAEFMTPEGLAIDSLNNIYVTDTDANKIRKITPEGVVTTIAGGGPIGAPAEGEALDVRFSTSRDIAVDREGDLYVVDGGGNIIRKFVNP